MLLTALLLSLQAESTFDEARVREKIASLREQTALYPGYQIAMDLAKFGGKVVPFAVEGLRSDDAATRKWCARTLTNLGRETATPAGADLLRALGREGDAETTWYLAQSVGVARPDVRQALPVLLVLLGSETDGVRGAGADALAEYGPDARSATLPLIAALPRGGLQAEWRIVAALKAIGMTAEAVEVLKTVRLDPRSRVRRDLLSILFDHPAAAADFIRNNPGILGALERNDVLLVELFSRTDEAREPLRRFLLEQKDLPAFLRIDRAEGERWGIVRTWPRIQDPRECFPQREFVVKVRDGRALLDELAKDSSYQLWVRNGTGLLTIDNKVGYIDPEGRILIPPAYASAAPFSDGLAVVQVAGLYGYIDPKGAVVIPLRFDYAYDFRDGVAGVRLGDQWGLLDRKGGWILPPTFRRIDPLVGGWFGVAEDGREGFLDPQGKFR